MQGIMQYDQLNLKNKIIKFSPFMKICIVYEENKSLIEISLCNFPSCCK